jgi:peptide/nickel transport system permease protein
MTAYILRRLLISIPVLLGITLLTFTAYNLAPGDPIDAMIDPSVAMDPADLENLRQQLGLDQPMFVRYGIWLTQAVQGNLGFSYRTGEAVSQRIADRLPNTLQLTLTALAIAVGLGIPLGTISALRQYSRVDYFLTLFAFTGISIPSFFFALGAIYILSLKLKFFPSSTMGDPDADYYFIERLHHLILPALVLGLDRVASFLRYTRSSMLEVLSQDYMTTAKAKGLGQMAITAVTQRDYPVLMGVALVTSLAVLVSNLLADIAYAWADPRIRYS